MNSTESLVFAYGSNLSVEQMAARCPESIALFPASLANFELVFQANGNGRNVANLLSANGGVVAGAVYAVSASDLAALDKREGHPNVYRRSLVNVTNILGESVEAWAYIMPADDARYGAPADAYLEIVKCGYLDWGLNGSNLEVAINRNTDTALTVLPNTASNTSEGAEIAGSALYLCDLFARNFRIFGPAPNRHLEMTFDPGLTVLVGENDAGKSAILDAIRFTLGTTARDSTRLSVEDFYLHPDTGLREQELEIRCKFQFKNDADAAMFAEYLTIEDGRPCLYVALTARLPDSEAEEVGLRRGIAIDIRTGRLGEGPRLDGFARNLLSVTYLKPLRDAANELASGRGSRLARILSSHKSFAIEKENDFDPSAAGSGTFAAPTSLAGIVKFIAWAIERNALVREAQGSLNEILSDGLSLATEHLRGNVGMAKTMDLRELLEKLELFLGSTDARTNRGLGSNNVLYMAAELLLLRSSNDGGLPLLLIEEPEAHLHPQWQLTVMDYLQAAAEADSRSIQVILTTHSPTLASRVKLKHLAVIQQGAVFKLAPGYTKLDASDYRYLERFLDSTRANLFFARGVLIVEGDAEALLLPALAEALGRPLSKYGVSVVNVGSTGLFRYAKIFQRPSGQQMKSVAVACVADLDPKDDADADARKRKRQSIEERYGGGPVRAFVAQYKTFEYDLVYDGMGQYLLRAIRLSTRFEDAQSAKHVEIIRKADEEFESIKKANQTQASLSTAIYQLVEPKKAPTAQVLAQMLLEDVENNLLSRANLVEMIPQYILDALSFVTGGSDISAK